MYDKESVYDEKIAPLMTEIIKICNEHDIKMFADFYLKEPDDDNDELHCTTSLNAGDNTSKRLTDCYNIALKGYVAEKPFFAAFTVTK